LSTISYSKNNKKFQTLEPFISLGERVGRCMCWVWQTELSQSLNQYLTAPSGRPAQQMPHQPVTWWWKQIQFW
jgi:hypothetical protein